MVTKVIMPKLGETMEEGQIGKWLSKEGEKVKKGEALVEVATDKANFEVESPAAGFLRKILGEEGATVAVTEVIGYIADSMEEELPEEKAAELSESVTPASKAASPPPEAVSSPAEKMERTRISPLARKLAEQKGIDISQIKGTGPGGRIVKEDVEGFQAPAKAEGEEIALSRIRKIIAQRLSQSKREAPHYYLQTEIDMSDAVRLREDLLPEIERTSSVRLSLTDLVIRSVALSLEQFSPVNSTYENEKLKSFRQANVGIATSLDDGLIVPVVKNAGKKALWQIAQERTRLVALAKGGKLTQQDISGGTFTISNLGGFGVDVFTAIINPPEVAILAVGAVKERPIVSNGQLVIRQMMRVSLSLDHRVVDGVIGAQFLSRIKELLEKPYLLLITPGGANA